VHSQEDRPGPRRIAKDLPGGLEPVQQRHGEIEHGHVGNQIADPPDGLLAIRGLADDLEPRALQEHFQAFADHLVVIGYEDLERQVALLWPSAPRCRRLTFRVTLAPFSVLATPIGRCRPSSGLSSTRIIDDTGLPDVSGVRKHTQ